VRYLRRLARADAETWRRRSFRLLVSPGPSPKGTPPVKTLTREFLA
jgi:hypothetical protein